MSNMNPPPNQPPMPPNQPPMQPPMGYPGAAAPVGNLASWGQRAGAYLIDAGISILGSIVSYIAMISYTATLSTTTYDPNNPMPMEAPSLGPLYYVGLLISLAGLGFFIWSYLIKQGKTGQSFGKEKMGIRVIDEQTGQPPVGALAYFLRWLCHIVDGLPCYLGFLWPLWDAKKQTFCDKILHTVVVKG